MRLIRSWPPSLPPGRAHVVDKIERFTNARDFDYSELAEFDDDVLLLEWDIAVGREEIEHFAEHALREPERVLTAPYKLYRDSTYRGHWPEPENPWVWMLNHWRGDGVRPNLAQGVDIPGSHTLMPEAGDPTCNGFGFGMVYVPCDLLRGFVEANPGEHLGDVSFSVWHYHNVRPDARICWHVRPVHLNYEVPSLVRSAPERELN